MVPSISNKNRLTPLRFGAIIQPTFNNLPYVPRDITDGSIGQKIHNALSRENIPALTVVDYIGQDEYLLPEFWRDGDGTPYILTGPEREYVMTHAPEGTPKDALQHVVRFLLKTVEALYPHRVIPLEIKTTETPIPKDFFTRHQDINTEVVQYPPPTPIVQGGPKGVNIKALFAPHGFGSGNP